MFDLAQDVGTLQQNDFGEWRQKVGASMDLGFQRVGRSHRPAITDLQFKIIQN